MKKFSYFHVSSMLKKLKHTQNHCETNCVKLWKKWFCKNNHTNCLNHIEIKNAIKWLIQWNIYAKCLQNFNTNVIEKRISKFMM